MRWIDTTSLKDTKRRSAAYRRIVKIQSEDGLRFGLDRRPLCEEGVFWADEIKKLKDKPHARHQIALRHLPLPSAFREAAVALRVLMKQVSSRSEYTDELLAELHRLAAVESFSIPYSPKLGVPGFNVMELVPYSEFTKMDLSWSRIGGEKLQLLNRSDLRRMTERWGTPKANLTAHALYSDVWSKYERVFENEEKTRRAPFLEMLVKPGSRMPNSN